MFEALRHDLKYGGHQGRGFEGMAAYWKAGEPTTVLGGDAAVRADCREPPAGAADGGDRSDPGNPRTELAMRHLHQRYQRYSS